MDRFDEVGDEFIRDAGPFRVRGYHQHIYPDRMPMKVFHDRLEQLVAHDYNLVVFGMGSPASAGISMHADGTITPNGCSTEGMCRLVAHAVELGLEPVFEMKFIGKQLPLLGEVIDRHPGLVIDPKNRSTVLNADFSMPDGTGAYDATALRLVDYLLSLYPEESPARYFFFGIDEFSSDDMAVLAEKLGKSPPEAFAYCLNLGTDHVLSRGITPIIWGDTLLSSSLGTENHGIDRPGYRPDARLTRELGGAYHATYKSTSDSSLHRMVNYLRDIDRIVVADWHYHPSETGEFPSVDYFQKLGFKDVWAAPWHNPVNIRQFARYAASRKCGGLLATAWGDAYDRSRLPMLRYIIGTVGAYAHAPGLDPVPPGPVEFVIRGESPESRADEKGTGVILSEERELTFRAPVPEAIDPVNAILSVTPPSPGKEGMESLLRFDAESRELVGEFGLPPYQKDAHYRVGFSYADSASGYVYVKQANHGFMVMREPPDLPDVARGVLLEGDFSRMEPGMFPDGIWLAGEFSGPLGVRPARRRNPREIRGEGLDLQSIDRVWYHSSSAFNTAICRGFVLEIEVRLIGSFEGDPYCALLTKGTFNTGFRILMKQNRQLLFQLAGLAPENAEPLWVTTQPGSISMDAWTKLQFLYLPPGEKKSGSAVISVNGAKAAEARVVKPMMPSDELIGIGCEFTRPAQGPYGKRRPNFPGLIRSICFRPNQHRLE